MATPSITLRNANNKFSEIAWTYDNFTVNDVAELALISVTDNDINSLITKKILIPSQTYVNLIDLIDLTITTNICIEITHTDGKTYSSNILKIPKRLSTPAIYNPDANSSSPYKIFTQNQAVDFFVYNIENTQIVSAQFFNFILYESKKSKVINELPDIAIPGSVGVPTTVLINGINIKCTKLDFLGNYQISLSNLINDGSYQIGLYVTNKYSNEVSQSNIENESIVSNTIMYIEPNTDPQTPILKSISFDIKHPTIYTFEIMTPPNSSSYTTTFIKLYISTNSNFPLATTNKVELDISNLQNPIPSSAIYSIEKDLHGIIVAGNTYYYKIVVFNVDSDSENTIPLTNVLSLQACSTPTISDATNIKLDDTTLTWNLPSTDINVNYKGSGTIQTNVINNSTTYTNVTSPYNIQFVLDTVNTISLGYVFSNIITKTSYNGTGSNPTFTTYDYITGDNNLKVGPFTTEKYYNRTITPVTYIKASVLNSDNSIPVPGTIKLNWTPSSNNGTTPQYEIIYSNSSNFANSSTITTSDNNKTITGLTNDIKYYFKIVTIYDNAPLTYILSNKSMPVTINRTKLSSTNFTLMDSLNDPIGVSPFVAIQQPTNFALESSKESIKSTWNSVVNPLSSSGKPSPSAPNAPTVTYGVYLGTSTPNITSNTNYNFTNITDGIIDGTTYTVNLKAILNNVYPYFESSMNFSNPSTSVISFSSSVVSGTAKPFNGPDINFASYNEATNVISLTIKSNGTLANETTVLIMGVTSNAKTFSYTSLLDSSNFVKNNVDSNTTTYSLSLTPSYVTSGDKVTQFVTITVAESGISFASFGFNGSEKSADTLKKF